MKKYVLSAVVTSLLVVPSVYAMDGGAAPAVEVEVPMIEVEVATVDVSTLDITHVICIDPVVEVDPSIPIEPLDPIDPAIAVDPSGVDIKVDGEHAVCEFPEHQIPVDENGDPKVFYCFGGMAGGELPSNTDGSLENQESIDGQGDVVRNTMDLASQSGVDVQLQSFDNIHPNFRNLMTDRGAGSLAASAAVDTNSPNPQLLNDEQREAVRGLRVDEESAKPRTGLGKLFSKFRKSPKSEVTLASATTTDKSLTSKLAEVDRMRDTALRIGDQKMLVQADQVERSLRAKASKVTTRKVASGKVAPVSTRTR